MSKKTETNPDADVQAGKVAQDSPTVGDDGMQEVINNVDTIDDDPENTAPEQISDADSGQETDPLTAMTAERDALKDQLLRALADTENMRRRSEREADTARKYGHTQFARDLVGAIDN